jgi:hypothetical protein
MGVRKALRWHSIVHTLRNRGTWIPIERQLLAPKEDGGQRSGAHRGGVIDSEGLCAFR